MKALSRTLLLAALIILASPPAAAFSSFEAPNGLVNPGTVNLSRHG